MCGVFFFFLNEGKKYKCRAVKSDREKETNFTLSRVRGEEVGSLAHFSTRHVAEQHLGRHECTCWRLGLPGQHATCHVTQRATHARLAYACWPNHQLMRCLKATPLYSQAGAKVWGGGGGNNGKRKRKKEVERGDCHRAKKRFRILKKFFF